MAYSQLGLSSKCFLEWYLKFSKGVNLNSFLQPETKIAEFTNRVDLDEVAHIEPPHLDQHCLPSVF